MVNFLSFYSSILNTINDLTFRIKLMRLPFADFTFIHSKFLGPLPPTEHEFMCSLRMAFDNVIDVGHLLQEIGPLRRAKNIPSALNYLKRQFFIPVDLEIPFGGINPSSPYGFSSSFFPEKSVR